ncbi:MAG TPA: hypothetical protein VJQ55_16600 [Candidatus Binatia bacterium]|nr:hypothetical protein [Candidatus Binatia bacterium]
MKRAGKKSLIAAALLGLMTVSAGCAVYDYDDRYRYGRYDRWDRYSRVDLDRDGRVEQWERNRVDRDNDGRVERWERNRYAYDRRSPDWYYDRDWRYRGWRYDWDNDRRYSDRFDR